MIERPLSPFEVAPDPEARELSALERRRDATQATIEHFREDEFRPGRWDCWKMVTWHCRKLGVPMRFGEAINYTTLLGGAAIMRRLGFANLGEAVGSQFPEIRPAEALVGDIIELRALEADAANLKGLGALVVYCGNAACFGYHEAATGGIVMRYGEGTEAPLRAWRVMA